MPLGEYRGAEHEQWHYYKLYIKQDSKAQQVALTSDNCP